MRTSTKILLLFFNGFHLVSALQAEAPTTNTFVGEDLKDIEHRWIKTAPAAGQHPEESTTHASPVNLWGDVQLWFLETIMKNNDAYSDILYSDENEHHDEEMGVAIHIYGQVEVESTSRDSGRSGVAS